MICGRWFCDDHGGPVSRYLVNDPKTRKGLFCGDCWQDVKAELPRFCVSVAEFEERIRSLGIVRGDVIEVHSSLGAFGKIEATPGQLVESLKDIVTRDGTILMPTFMESDESDPTTASSQAGVLTDAFWRSEGAVRGSGRHAWTSWGRCAEAVRGPTDLLAHRGQCVGLGVGFWTCTMIHVPEWQSSRKYPCVCPEAFYRHQLEVREKSASYQEAHIGNAVCWSCDAADIADHFSEKLQSDPLSLLCSASAGCLLCDRARVHPERTWGT
jgi:aminoglycoside N3'-acetyltransferase